MFYQPVKTSALVYSQPKESEEKLNLDNEIIIPAGMCAFPLEQAQSVAKWNWHRRHKIRESESRDGLQEVGREKGGLPLVFPKLVFRVQFDLPKQSLASRMPGCVNGNQNSFIMTRPGFQARKLRKAKDYGNDDCWFEVKSQMRYWGSIACGARCVIMSMILLSWDKL